MTPLPFTPLIIIGAGRSGTNILRDTLCALDGFATWDCDEINPVWRHGNIGAPHDEFGTDHARPSVTAFIRATFMKQWERQGRPEYLVEKTCANSLRVPFIRAILPEAKFLFIVRDGVDVLASAQKRWRGEMELESWPYYAAKIRNTPMLDLPIYGWRFAAARVGRVLGQQEHLSFWGPQFGALSGLPKDTPLDDLCAMQWVRCVEKADADLGVLPSDHVHQLRYEDLTAAPTVTISSILSFLSETRSDTAIAAACAPISGASVGKGRRNLGARQDDILAILSPTLTKFGYATSMEQAA